MKTELELIIEWGEYRINYRLTQLLNRWALLDIYGNIVGIRGVCYPRNYVERNQDDSHYGWIKTKYDDVYFDEKYGNFMKPDIGILEYDEWKAVHTFNN